MLPKSLLSYAVDFIATLLKIQYSIISLSLSLPFIHFQCCLDGSSIHQPIFCCSSHSPDTCPHPVLHILLTRSLWPSSVPFPFNFLLLLVSPVFRVFYVSERTFFLLFNTFRSVPDVTLSSEVPHSNPTAYCCSLYRFDELYNFLGKFHVSIDQCTITVLE